MPRNDSCITTAGNARRDHKVFFTQRKKFAAYAPRQMCPSQERNQDRNREVHALGRPFSRHSSCQSHP